MAFEKINSADMRRNNYKTVLDTIRFSEGISRKAIAKTIGLTSATITNIVADLLHAGYVRETGLTQTTGGGGRREIALSIDPDACYAVGVELSASNVICVLTDFAAGIRAEQISRIDAAAMKKETIIDMIVDTVEAVIRSSGVPREKIRGIGLSTPGPIDIENGIIINPPNLRCLRNVPIRDIISGRTGFPVLFEHHMNAAALCESWMGRAHGSKCMFLCAVLEVGVGGSVMIDGKLHHGSRNVAGEIGHMSIDPNGADCPVCGKRGCLEPLAEGRALVASVRRRLTESPALMKEYGITGIETVDTDMIVAHAERGDALFREELMRHAGYVGQALSNIITVLSPDTIVLMGELADKSPLYVDTVSGIIRALKYPEAVHTIPVYATAFKRFVSALGGAAMVLNGVL